MAWVLTVCLFLLAAPAARAEPGPDLLSALWTPEQLRPDPAERHTGPNHPGDDAPPARTAPGHVLPVLALSGDKAAPGGIRRVDLPPGAPRYVALTFDLCELAPSRTGYEGAIPDLLRAHGAKATFFASGKWLRSHPERAQQLLADPRFEIGNHAWTHGNLAVLARTATQAQARDQVLWTQAQYELTRAELARRAAAAGLSAEMARIPEVPVLFRPPYGRCSPESLKLLAGLGLAAIQWDVVASEGPGDAEAAARDILARVRPGSIILMHANGVPANSAAVLGHLLPALIARGFVPATVSELLRAGTPKAEAQCYFNHPGDNLFLDEQFGDGTRRVKQPPAPAAAPAKP